MRILLCLAFALVANCKLQKRAECIFPFNYKSESYNECIKVDGASPWCSATLDYVGSFYYCNEEQAESYESSDAYLTAQEKLVDNANILKKLQEKTDIPEYKRSEASVHAAVTALTDMRKIADDNERRLGWIGEKRGKDMEEFITSIEGDLIKLVDCPSGMIGRENHCYSFGVAKSFNQAKDFCKKQSSEFVTIHSAAENKWVYDNVKKLLGTSRQTYLGLNDIRSEGKFEWTDKSEVNYLSWNRGEPNAYPGENCVEMYASTGKWNDISCFGNKNYVCKNHVLEFF